MGSAYWVLFQVFKPHKQPHEADIIIPILQVGKVRYEESTKLSG